MIIPYPDTPQKRCMRSQARMRQLHLTISEYLRYDNLRQQFNPFELKKKGEEFGWTDVQIVAMEGMRNERN